MILTASAVDIWLARESQWRDPKLLSSLPEIFSEEDRERVARMRFPEGQQEQRITRTLVRRVLSLYVPEVAPAAWRFEARAHGRPVIAQGLVARVPAAGAIHFNIAHTRGLVVMAVSRLPDVGVDVERGDGRAPLEVAQRYFSPREIDALEALPPAEQPHRFRRLWTLKEAYLKALGTGVAGGLDSMTFHLDGPVLRFERADDASAADWEFREFDVDGEFLLALAVLPIAGQAPEVRLRDYLPRASGEEQGAEAE